MLSSSAIEAPMIHTHTHRRVQDHYAPSDLSPPDAYSCAAPCFPCQHVKECKGCLFFWVFKPCRLLPATPPGGLAHVFACFVFLMRGTNKSINELRSAPIFWWIGSHSRRSFGSSLQWTCAKSPFETESIASLLYKHVSLLPLVHTWKNKPISISVSV
eukprot:1434085-Amphidinium_carterae.1